MRVVTFYSYKGGVGRTLACANFGLYLAKTGQKVVLADMDFEAPGLDSKFPGVDVARISCGMIDQFHDFQTKGAPPDLDAETIPLPDDVVQSGGSLHLIPAGDYTSCDYYPKLSELQWDFFLHETEGLAFCLDLVKRIERSFGADVLVIDSRTGLTEIGGLCTQVFPDDVILLTCASRESLSGTRRIYKRIRDSPIVNRRAGGRTEVDLRIVVARIPRPDNLPSFDRAMKERVGLPIERLYYLFDQRDMSVEEYLALDRFAEVHPDILDDYVELFASLSPEIMLPYIEQRLDGFRSGVTRRSVQDNERLIEELRTLFPRPEVFLEAARYYRIAKNGDAECVANYLRYLEHREKDSQALAEFAEVCASVPEALLQPRTEVAARLKAFGADNMDAKLLGRYFRMARTRDAWQEVVRAIEGDEAKIHSKIFRLTYIEALRALEDWERIVEVVSEQEARGRPIQIFLAEAHASLGNLAIAQEVLRGYEVGGPDDWESFLKVAYKAIPEANLGILEDFVGELRGLPPLRRHLDYILHGPGHMRLRKSEDPEFVHWIERLRHEARDSD